MRLEKTLLLESFASGGDKSAWTCLACQGMGAMSFVKQARGPESREAVGRSGRLPDDGK